MSYIVPGEGQLNTLYVDDYWIIDKFFGDRLWTWGNNASYGGLGDNTVINKSSPAQTIAGGINWKSVVCGDNHTAAIKTDGTLWIWGSNTQGQLGDNSLVNKSSPVQTITGGNTDWQQVACAYEHTAAIKTDGTLWSWGSNVVGNLGDNTVTKKSSPVQTIAGGTNWKLVDGGRFNTFAIKTDGTLWSWGQDQYGQLGDNTRVNKSSPVQTIAVVLIGNQLIVEAGTQLLLKLMVHFGPGGTMRGVLWGITLLIINHLQYKQLQVVLIGNQ